MEEQMTLFENKKHYRNLAIGILIILSARLSLAVVVLLSRFASETVSMSQIFFFQNMIAFLFLVPLFSRMGLRSLKVENAGFIMIRIVAGLLSFIFLLISAQEISLTGSILLSNSGPLFVPLVALVWLKIPINKRLWPGLVLGFFGLGLVLHPWSAIGELSTKQFELGTLYGILSGIFLSVAVIALRELRFNKALPILFYYYLFSSFVTFPTALLNWTAPSGFTLWCLVWIGLLSLFNQWSYLVAFRFGKADHLAPFFYSSVIFGGFFDWLFFNHVLNAFMIVGTVILIIGGILVIIYSKNGVTNNLR